MATIERLENELAIPIIDQDGELIEERILNNVPFVEIFDADTPVCFIDWRAADGKKPTVEQLQVPITYSGTVYNGAWAWGSAVKQSLTTGLERDLMREIGLMDFDEDAMRFNRVFLGEGVFGGLKGTMTVQIAKPHTLTNGVHPNEDGFGYIRRSVAEKGWNERGRIHLETSRDSAQFAQRFSVDVWDVVRPLVRERMDIMGQPGTRGIQTLTYLEEKKRWVGLNKEMVRHPYVANALDRSSSDMFARGASSIPTNSHVKVAVPSRCNKFVTEKPMIGYRYPLDAWGSIQAVEADGDAEEIARIDKMEVIQFSMSSDEMGATGLLGVLDDSEMPDGVDIIICADDIKLRKGNPNHRKRCGTIEFDGCVSFTQWYDAGSAIGIGYRWFSKVMGGDFDGDLVTFFRASDIGDEVFWVLFNKVLRFPKQGTPKLKKSKIRVTEAGRATFAWSSMANLVGYAANMQASTFAVQDREAVATGMGFASMTEMDDYFRQVIQLSVDGYKSSKVYLERDGKNILVTIPETEENLGRLQTSLVGILGGLAPWNGWNRDEFFFRHTVPSVIEESLGDSLYRVDGRERPIYLSKAEVKGAVRPIHDTLIAKIARETLPAIQSALGATIAVRPLAYHKRWAPNVSEEEFVLGKEYVAWFSQAAPKVSWNSGDAVRSFRNNCECRFSKFVKKHGLTREVAFNAIWQAAHSKRSRLAGAGAPFLACPELAEITIRDKPGMRAVQFRATLVGLKYQVATDIRRWSGEVEVKEMPIRKNNRTLLRLFVRPVNTAGIEFVKKSGDDQYPEGWFGMLSKIDPGVQEGIYNGALRVSGRSASITLQSSAIGR